MPSSTREQSKRESVRNLRARRRAQGRVLVTTDLPADLIEAIDLSKEAKGMRGRTPIIEAALRFYFEKHQGA